MKREDMATPPSSVTSRSATKPKVKKPKRSWRSRLGEFAIWAGIAILTAVLMIIFSEQLLPNNF
jgi:hypothetical protein